MLLKFSSLFTVNGFLNPVNKNYQNLRVLSFWQNTLKHVLKKFRQLQGEKFYTVVVPKPFVRAVAWEQE